MPIFFFSNSRRWVAWLPAACAILLLTLPAGCKRFRHESHDKVYVSARQMYLHDRVAAVSNRVAQVTNGQPLEVLDHARRFLKVKTEKNEIGWIEEHAVIDSKTHDQFVELSSQHRSDLVVATAVLRDDLYLHLHPGRETERFTLIAGNAKVQLLARASVVKTPVPGSIPAPISGSTPASGAAAASAKAPKAAGAAPPSEAAKSASSPAGQGQETAAANAGSSAVDAPAVAMEDWWLVRDGQGNVGWLLSSRLDVEVPDEIGVYAEGQRIVGAYVLTKIVDPEAATPNHEVPEYVTVLSPAKSGLPFDFDQVRVFTWSLKKHRYETAFRVHPVEGYLPVKVAYEPIPGGSLPVFSFQIAGGAEMRTDPATGVARPAALRTLRYTLNQTQVKRVGPDLAPLPSSHSDDEKSGQSQAKSKTNKKAKAAKKSR